MKEGESRPQPSAEPQAAASRRQLGLDVVRRLPSGAILDGLYAGTIRDPEAPRAYVLRRRTEFLQAFPEREAALAGEGPIGRWHGLVYSETAAEYQGLAGICDEEIKRRGALAPPDGDDGSGLENLRRIGAVWRHRATALRSDYEPTVPVRSAAALGGHHDHLLPGAAAEPERRRRVLETEAAPATEPAADYAHLMDHEILNGIDEGTITDPEAVHVYVRKSLDALRGIHHGAERSRQEAAYAELVYGEPGDMARLCVRQADAYMAFDYPTAVGNPANYAIAARWYTMAARMAGSAEQGRSPAASPAGGAVAGTREAAVVHLSRMSATEIRRVIDEGTTTAVDAVHCYVRKALERDRLRYDGERLKEIEAQYAELIFADPKDMVRYCLQQAERCLPDRDRLDAMGADPGAAGRWYAMAARFAHQAAACGGRQDRPGTAAPPSDPWT